MGNLDFVAKWDIESRYIPEPNTGCWLFTSIGNHGYGVVWDGNQLKLAHRIAYERFKGPVPEGLTIDHLCRTKSCINPDHLEVVTIRENVRRAMSRKIRCVRGHEYYTKLTKAGHRFCMICHTEYKRRWREQRRETGLVAT